MKKIKKIKNIRKINLFICLLISTLECAEKEKNIILDGKESPWYLDHIQEVVIPEISLLLSYANNGEAYFEFGKWQRFLRSTYLLTDYSVLYNTDLGKSISKLQDIYDIL